MAAFRYYTDGCASELNLPPVLFIKSCTHFIQLAYLKSEHPTAVFRVRVRRVSVAGNLGGGVEGTPAIGRNLLYVLNCFNFYFSQRARLEVYSLLVDVRVSACIVDYHNGPGELGLDLRREAVVAFDVVMGLVEV